MYDVLEKVYVNSLDPIDKLIVCDPKQRITVDEALSHEYFHSIPPPAPLTTCNLPQFGTQFYFYCNHSNTGSSWNYFAYASVPVDQITSEKVM